MRLDEILKDLKIEKPEQYKTAAFNDLDRDLPKHDPFSDWNLYGEDEPKDKDNAN